jgi:putative nucleotidyltransferase with HDIG domain
MKNLEIAYPQKWIERFEDKNEIKLSPEVEKILSDSAVCGEALENMKKHDMVTYDHLVSMANLADRLAAEFDFYAEDKKLLVEACVVHDLGKEYIDPKILNKKGKLSDEEFDEIKTHPVVGAIMLKSKFRLDLADIIILHHALKENKNPYPSIEEIEKILPGHAERMKKNSNRMLLAQILADIDKADALLAPDRPYREPSLRSEAKKIVSGGSSEEAFVDYIIENTRPGREADHGKNLDI